MNRGTILPTRRFALVVAVTAPAWLLAFSEPGRVVVALCVGSVVALVLWDLIRLPAAEEFTVTRHLPESGGLGDPVAGAYQITSRWNTVVAGCLFDSVPAMLRAGPAPAVAFTLPRSGSVRIPILFSPARRGRWKLGPVAIRVAAPLGLVQRTIRYRIEDSIAVAPSLNPVRGYRLLTLHHRLRQIGVRTIRRRGEGRAFSNLRDYASGDDPRLIDWKHTARRGKLISREFTEERGQTVIIAVDAGRMMTQLAGDLPRFELALSSALVLSTVAIANGDDRVGLIVFDEKVRSWVPPARGTTALRAIRDALMPIEPALVEPDYSLAFATLSARQRSRALIVLFTDLIDVHASRALIANTTRGGARHMHLVVALRSDALFSAARPRPESGSNGLYTSAAAEELVLARGDALRRMRNSGVAVVDVSPSAMTAAVVNRYLEIKARGAL